MRIAQFSFDSFPLDSNIKFESSMMMDLKELNNKSDLKSSRKDFSFTRSQTKHISNPFSTLVSQAQALLFLLKMIRKS